MTTTTTNLRNRHPKGTRKESDDSGCSTEGLLIARLDVFLARIEHRLEQFEKFFQLVGSGVNERPVDGDDKEVVQNPSRRGSIVSVPSLKDISMSHMNQIYEQLRSVKDHVLKMSVTNLEYLCKTLDEKYNDLFNVDGDSLMIFDQYPSKEVLSRKIIDTIQFFEQKLADIDQYIKSKTPAATENYDQDSKFNRFRFFNFNKALITADEKYLHYYQLPLGWRENRYIIHGYRFTLKHKDMIRSMFYFNHNETANIWTHIIGTLCMLYLGFIHFPSTDVYEKNSWKDNLVIGVFLAAAIDCLMSSVLWHTYSCFARIKIRNRFACVDYTGITVLITCSVISAEYCALYDHPKVLTGFLSLSVLAGAGGFFFNWSPHFDKPLCRPLRIVFFVCLALLGATTFLCKWKYEGFVKALYFYLPLTYNSFVWYWAGVVFYGGLIPERWRYDIIINEDATCRHMHSTTDILTGQVEDCGEEEMEEMKQEMKEVESELEVEGWSSSHGSNAASVHKIKGFADDEEKYKDILAKHFPPDPVKTPYHRDLMSLWWVDYIMSSHNIWHVCVVLGVMGHYFSVLGMFRSVRDANHLTV